MMRALVQSAVPSVRSAMSGKGAAGITWTRCNLLPICTVSYRGYAVRSMALRQSKHPVHKSNGRFILLFESSAIWVQQAARSVEEGRKLLGNEVAEGLNLKIQTINANARGYRSFEGFRNSILFYCGGLDMRP
jgi:hypothetical protein